MKNILSFLLIFLAGGALAQRIIDPVPRPPIPPTIQNQALDTKSLRIEADINFNMAKVKFTQVFHNPTSGRIEGNYIFPIPKGMTIHHFSMKIDGQPVNAELLEAKKARKIYNDIVRRQIDPALMEYQDGGLIKLQIFPIAPHADRQITLEFETALTKDNQLSLLEIPMPSTKIQDLILDFKIAAKQDIGAILCPTHEIDVAYTAKNKAHASAESKNVLGGRLLRLYLDTKKGNIDSHFLSYQDSDGERYFQWSLSPGFANQEEIAAKDITFALDVSGSMRGPKIEQAKKALSFCINHLNDHDRFNIVRFSTEAAPLFSERRPASAKNIKIAQDWIAQLKPSGGTNIFDALDIALTEKIDPKRPEMTVFITDGRPTIGQTIPKEIIKMVDEKLNKNRRIFTFGVGNDLNIKLLDLLTDHSNGYRTYVTEQENIEIKVSSFFRKVSSPVLTDIQITTSPNIRFSALQPKVLPNLFSGSTLLLFGKYSGKGKIGITLTGKINGSSKTYTYEFNPKPEIENDFIPRLWATRKVAYLYDQIRLNGESQEVKDELITTAKKYGIITPYTSFLIIDNEADLLRQGTLGMEDVIWNQGQRKLPPTPAAIRTTTQESAAIQKSRRTANAQASLKKALDYVDEQGKQQNLASEVQFANGRAFYRQNSTWRDARLILKKTKIRKEKKIIYASKAYFDLLAQKEFKPYLSLGVQVVFVHQHIKYTIVAK
ncbi:MAG TPA: VWA domain-containing protein [Saprospiraceae bacterium]|nr:VWA domain-containing protein [Saprospiraceae bacterium]